MSNLQSPLHGGEQKPFELLWRSREADRRSNLRSPWWSGGFGVDSWRQFVCATAGRMAVSQPEQRLDTAGVPERKYSQLGAVLLNGQFDHIGYLIPTLGDQERR